VWLILISSGCLTSPTFFFFFCNKIFWLAHCKKKLKLWRPPQNRRFYWKLEYLPLWPTYTSEKGRTLGKTYGIKARCYWEHIGNLGNIFENLKGKCWEQKENEKKSSPHPIPRPPPPKLKRKKFKVPRVHAFNLPIGCMYFWFPKLLVIIFGLLL
jgi:hypothetical protein